MFRNLGQAVIRVVSNSKPFVQGLNRQMKKAAQAASKQGSLIGKKFSDAFGNAFSMRSWAPLLLAALPLITSALSAVAGAATAVGGSLLRAAISSASLVGIMGSLAQGAVVGAIAFKGLGEAIGGDAKAMAKLHPEAQKFAKSLQGLKPQLEGIRRSVQGAVFDGLANNMSRLGNVLLPVVEKQFAGTGRQLNLLLKDLTRFGASESFVKRFNGALAGNNRIFAQLRQAAVPFLNGLLNLYRALQPAAGRFAEKIVEIARGFSQWTKGEGFAQRIDAYMRKASGSMSVLWGLTKNLGRALWNVLNASAGAGDGLLKSLSDVIGKFADWSATLEGKNAIANWAQQGVNAVKTFASLMSSLAGFLAPIFNPAIIQTFLNVMNSLKPTMSAVFGVIQSALQPVLDAIGPALAELGPKISKLFVALAPLLKGLGMVIGQVITQAASAIGTILDLITPVIAKISGFLGPIIQKFAPVIAFLILGFTNMGSKLVGLVPIIGKFMAPLIKLYEVVFKKIITGIGTALKWFSKLGPVFNRIAGALQPFITAMVNAGGTIASAIKVIVQAAEWLWDVLFGHSIFPDIQKALGVFVAAFKAYFNVWVGVFRFALSVITTVMRAIWTGVTMAWNGIKNAFTFAVNLIRSVVARYFALYRAIITTVLNAIRAVVSRVWNGIRAVITGVVNGIRNVVTRVFNGIKNTATGVFNALKNGISKAFTGIKNTVTTGVTNIVDKIKGLPGKLASLASKFLTSGKNLGGKIVEGMGQGLKNIVNGLGDFGQLVKDKINKALGLPRKIHGPGPIPDFTIPAFRRGTKFAPGGLALVGEGGPELVNLPRGSQVYTAAQTRAMQRAAAAQNGGGARFPSRLVLRIGARDFIAYVQEIADDRIEAADSLAYQGA